MTNSQSTSSKNVLIVISVMFFVWGILFCMNDILVPQFKSLFTLTYFKASLVQFTFFGTYFLISIPAGKLISAYGYKKSILIGLALTTTGCLLFYPAAGLRLYGMFLTALFVVSSGITIMQVAANPFVAVLGKPEGAASRLNLAQAVNKLGYAAAPYIGAFFILSDGHADAAKINSLSSAQLEAYKTAQSAAIQVPYLILAGVLFLTFFSVYKSHLPDIKEEVPEGESFLHSLKKAVRYRHLMLGTIGIFMYVGAEVSTNAFFISFLSNKNVAGFTETAAAAYLSHYWLLATITGFIGFVVLKYLNPGKVLGTCGIITLVLFSICLTSKGAVVAYTLVAIGGFISIMFPTIFTLAIEGLGNFTGRASAILFTAVVGGALLPPVQGLIADHFSIRNSYIVPCISYAYITCYGFFGVKKKAHQDRNNHKIHHSSIEAKAIK